MTATCPQIPLFQGAYKDFPIMYRHTLRMLSEIERLNEENKQHEYRREVMQRNLKLRLTGASW